MNIVADTNIFMAVSLNEPEKGLIVKLTSDMVVIAPEILPYEIGNALTAMVKRKQITPNEAVSVFGIANQIPVRLAQVDIPQALKLALDFNIYAYDAYFLHCAKASSCPLITLDNRMKQVAIKLNIEVLE
jgi:predicted nucleic acid-binding protein